MPGFEILNAAPIIMGNAYNPMFRIQKITAYAEPNSLLSTSLGTDGHKEAGTNEKEIPNNMIDK